MTVTVTLTAGERAALALRQAALMITVSIGPLPAPTVPEMTDLGLDIDEALDYVGEWDQAVHDAHFAGQVLELQALTRILDATATASTSPDLVPPARSIGDTARLAAPTAQPGG